MTGVSIEQVVGMLTSLTSEKIWQWAESAAITTGQKLKSIPVFGDAIGDVFINNPKVSAAVVAFAGILIVRSAAKIVTRLAVGTQEMDVTYDLSKRISPEQSKYLSILDAGQGFQRLEIDGFDLLRKENGAGFYLFTSNDGGRTQQIFYGDTLDSLKILMGQEVKNTVGVEPAQIVGKIDGDVSPAFVRQLINSHNDALITVRTLTECLFSLPATWTEDNGKKISANCYTTAKGCCFTFHNGQEWVLELYYRSGGDPNSLQLVDTRKNGRLLKTFKHDIPSNHSPEQIQKYFDEEALKAFVQYTIDPKNAVISYGVKSVMSMAKLFYSWTGRTKAGQSASMLTAAMVTPKAFFEQAMGNWVERFVDRRMRWAPKTIAPYTAGRSRLTYFGQHFYLASPAKVTEHKLVPVSAPSYLTDGAVEVTYDSVEALCHNRTRLPTRGIIRFEGSDTIHAFNAMGLAMTKARGEAPVLSYDQARDLLQRDQATAEVLQARAAHIMADAQQVIKKIQEAPGQRLIFDSQPQVA